MKLKYQAEREDKTDQNLYRDDLRERVAVLESRLEEERDEKDKRQDEITKLQTTLAEYKVRLEFFTIPYNGTFFT
jgi:chromosome segregation ATPase